MTVRLQLSAWVTSKCWDPPPKIRGDLKNYLVAQLPLTAAMSTVRMVFPDFYCIGRKNCSVQTSVTWCRWWCYLTSSPSPHPTSCICTLRNWHWGKKSRQKLTFVKRLRLGSCVEVTVLSQCQPPFPRVVSCNVFIYHYRRPKKFFFPFSLFCPRPQGSDRDQQRSCSDEAARQKLN